MKGGVDKNRDNKGCVSGKGQTGQKRSKIRYLLQRSVHFADFKVAARFISVPKRIIPRSGTLLHPRSCRKDHSRLQAGEYIGAFTE